MAVFTEQNRHPLVHVSPISMIVAVAALLELPPQQSEMFGHRASSQTVCRLRPRRSFLIFLKLSFAGIGVLSHSGSRVMVLFRPSGPTVAVLISYASAGSRGAFGLTKSLNEGPVFNLSWNRVEGRAGFAGFWGSTAVANPRMQLCEAGLRSDELARRQRVRGIAAVIAII